MSIQDEIYEDILINIQPFSKIRYIRDSHLPKVDPQSKEDKVVIHPWPNEYALRNFHRNNHEQLRAILREDGIQILSNDYIYLYVFEKGYESEFKNATALDYKRFIHLQNYFTVKRLKYWDDQDISISVELKYSNSFPNSYNDNLSTSNLELIEHLMGVQDRDELEIKIYQRSNPQKYMHLHYTQIPLVFDELALYLNTPINLVQKEKADETKDKGYILQEDKEIYEQVVEKSFTNFSKLADHPTLKSKTKQYFEDYRV